MSGILESEHLLKQKLSDLLGPNKISKERSSDFDLLPLLKPQKTELQSATVLIPITFDNDGPLVIFTRRAKHLRNHAGQIAFPGGKVEESDSSDMQAVIRECFEEIHLKSADVNILGMLAQHDTVTGYSISPFVGLIKNHNKLKPELSEVSEIFKIPLKFLLNKKNMQIQNYKFNGCQRSYYTIPYGPYYIWGATAYIIKTFSDLVENYEQE